jgi:sugar/nucleoside kinase (ribokinase family)
MLRLDPGDGRIRTTRTFRVWEGGGEYNVGRGLRRAFGMRTTVVTAIVNNEIGRLLEDSILQAALGFQVPEMDERLSVLDPANFKVMIAEALRMYPNFQAVGTTLRNAQSASINDWGATLWTGGEFYEAPLREKLEIYDRIGGGDSFASGVAYGFLVGKTPQRCVEYGAAHGALAMTTPGDTSMAKLTEVEAVINSKGARVVR